MMDIDESYGLSGPPFDDEDEPVEPMDVAGQEIQVEVGLCLVHQNSIKKKSRVAPAIYDPRP